ncbi:MAG TPA: hypothetical protein VFU15_03765 [Bacteroidia bacterium]|nr:hypothetical protein [Bacteroidia bacterium]
MKRAAFYILLVTALAWLMREAEYEGIRRNREGQFDKFNTCFARKNNFDLIIIGSSRAESHFRPDIIDSATGFHSYNAGMVGATLPFIEGTLEAYLENSAPPKYVVLNIDYHMFIASDDTIRYFPGYFPYLGNHALYEKFRERDPRFTYFKWIPFYSLPYLGSKYFDNALHGWFNVPGRYDSTYIRGYTPIAAASPADIDTITIKPYSPWLKESSWKSLDRIISICHEKNIKLIFVLSPLYHRLSEAIVNEKTIIARFHEIAVKNGFVLMDYSHTFISEDKTLFSDLDHMNRRGALYFSRLFSRDLAQYARR